MQPPRQPASTTIDNGLGRCVIFVLEPHPDTREALVGTLTETGCAVAGFETLTALLAELQHRDVDCVIADTSSPDALGLRLLSLLPASDRPPVILTAHDTELTDAVHAMRAGASDFLEKPFSRPVLLARLRHLMHARRPHSNGA